MTGFPDQGLDPWKDELEAAIRELVAKPLDVANVPDEHFDGGALPGGWSLQGYVGGDLTFEDSCMVVAAKTAGNYIYRACPNTDFVATMKCTLYSPGGVMFGIMCADDTGRGMGAGTYTNPDGVVSAGFTAGIYSTPFNSVDGIKGTVLGNGFPAWYRMRRVGNVFYAACSLDGRSWSPEVSSTLAFTATRIGFGAWYALAKQFRVDWFNLETG